MTAVYYDTSALIRLYVLEAFTEEVAAYVRARGLAVATHGLHELEMENGLWAKVFRKEMTQAMCREILAQVRKDTRNGRLVHRPVPWPVVFQTAGRLSSTLTPQSGCRSLDILHVAVARHWKCSDFVSLDERQLRAASMAGLKVVDVRGEAP